MENSNLNAKVLIIDDSPQNIDVAKELLELEGYQVYVATSGEKALARVELVEPELILLDIQMPGMDGFETCSELKKNPNTQNIPVIFLTALADIDNLIEGFRYGAVDYVTKPFRAEEVLARVNLHIKLKRLENDLRKANASKNKFFSILAHDMRNPFVSILGMTEILEEDFYGITDEEKISFIRDVRLTAQSAYKLLENLLLWSRSQIGTLKISKGNFNLKDVLKETLSDVSTSVSLKKINIINEIDLDTIVYADRSLIEIVLRNLLSNAVKFTQEEGKIIISSKVESGLCIVSIKDSGTGIKEELKEKLFDIASSKTIVGANNEKGNGIGLMLCKELSVKNGGDIWFESEFGKGATFHFSIPLKSQN